MKALIFTLLLICVVSTLAARKRSKLRENQDPAHRIAFAVKVLDDLVQYSTNPELNERYWNAFFAAYDLDENGLTKEEFHHGIDLWTRDNGFGGQSKPGTDAIFDHLNEDGNDVLTIDEAIKGSSSIFGWYLLITQNKLRLYSAELSEQLAETRCTDTVNSVAGFQVFPAVADEIAASWDADNDGQLSLAEVIDENDTLASMLFLEHLSRDEAEGLFNDLDEDGDGFISHEAGATYIRNYLNRVNEVACPGEDLTHVYDDIVHAEDIVV